MKLLPMSNSYQPIRIRHPLTRLPSIFVTNARSLFYKVDELAVIASSRSPSIIAVTETWLSEEIPDHLISIYSYTVLRADRKARVGGGVCVFVSNSFTATKLEITNHPDYFESLWLFFPKTRLLFVCAYVPPNVSISRAADVMSFFTETADNFMNSGVGQYLSIAGDFNRLNLNTLCFNNCLSALVTLPTRGDNVLDNVLISDELSSSYTCSVGAPLGSSDHNTIFCCPHDASHTRLDDLVTVAKIYDLRSSHVQRFLSTLSAVNWREYYNMSYSIDEKCSIFHEVINLCIKETIPCTTTQFVRGGKPWLTPLIKHLVDQRWAAFRNRDFARFNYLKMKVKLEIRKAKQRWGLKAQRSPKDLWRVTNTMTGRGKIPLDFLKQAFTTPEEAADTINAVFVSSFGRDDQLLPSPSMQTSYADDLSQLSELPISVVYECIRSLKLGKSSGPDCTPNVLYKKAALFLAKPLCHLFNLCLSKGEFPSYWKQAVVVPVPKIPRPTEIRDLRPISLLSSPSKVFEKALSKQLMSLFRSAAGPDQHGCFSGCSTATASIMIHDHATMLLDMENVCGVQIIAYDISKAFDQLSHKVILSRLSECCFPDDFIALIAAYLRNRSQRVRISGVQSTSKHVASGVPQGSVLGPLLFASVMGKLTRKHHLTGLTKFVDDITIVVPVFKDADENQHISDEDMNVRLWAEDVGLSINTNKSKCLAVRKSPNFSPIALPSVNFVDAHKILGVMWSTDLKWNKHFDAISRTFVSRLHCLRVLKGSLQTNELIIVYSSLLRALLEYCAPLFVGMHKETSLRVERLQKRAHNVICGRGCHCKMFESICERREAQALRLFQKAQMRESPLFCLLPPKSERTFRFILPFYKTSRRCSSFVPAMVLREIGFA